MNKKNDTRRKLRVKKETLRTLAAGELSQVAGGATAYIPIGIPKNNCTGRLSGCISLCE